MKSQGNLFNKIADLDNLALAYLKAVKGKQDRAEVIAFTKNLYPNLNHILDQIQNGEPPTGNYRFFTVYDPKQREICAAPFNQRVLHHAVMNVCEPVFEKHLIFDSYACRKDKGQRRAVLRARDMLRRNTWYLKLDIRKYFDSIDHAIMQRQLCRLFREKKVLMLFEKIFASYHKLPGKGLPIGNLISQHCANLYLSPFDHFIKDETGIKGYIRYMDDFLIFHTDKEVLKKLLVEIRKRLSDFLALHLKENIQLNRCLILSGLRTARHFAGPFLPGTGISKTKKTPPISLLRSPFSDFPSPISLLPPGCFPEVPTA